MSKFLLVYQARIAGPPQMSPEEQQKVMQAWGSWIERTGSALADVGAPTGDRSSVGGTGTPLPITGYSVVEAADLEAARTICDGHPFLVDAPSDFSIDIYELESMAM